MDINGYRGPEVALWSHNSPETRNQNTWSWGSLLEVWNAWSMGGVDTSWIGNAGIVTKSTSEGEILQCSDGVGYSSFTDLVVQISITPE